jgi:hypothetical protein
MKLLDETLDETLLVGEETFSLLKKETESASIGVLFGMPVYVHAKMPPGLCVIGGAKKIAYLMLLLDAAETKVRVDEILANIPEK